MPSINVVKEYRENSVYHIYNRGVEKRNTFLNNADYKRFLKYLKDALYKYEITTFCYSLLKNHFHLLIKQMHEKDIEKFMRSLITRYVMFFNFKYDRTGNLFQSPYKARIIETDEDFLNTSAYIHNNCRGMGIAPESYPYSSFRYYLGGKYPEWLNIEEILEYFKLEPYSVFVGRMRKVGPGLTLF